MKRFWTEVTVDAEGVVRLDDRPVRTPGRVPLALPSSPLAELVAEEWRAVGDILDPREMPLTGLANAAIDRIAPAADAFAAGLAAYGESDLLYYRAEEPPPLAERQAAAWDPLLDWAQSRYDVHFEVATGILHVPQPPATLARLAEAVSARGPFELAGLSPVVTITGSLIAALALAERAADPETVWQASLIDEAWQAEQWGEDPLALEARENRRRDFDAAARFLLLAR
ncbi:ATP12 family chaperone protein [Sphingomonas aracearum]|uniref:ATPase n=1 Tax=Sphingomonas aracearum TaxID=2283317 RepID=A0A369VYQ9_9SPHN|nr:ATP12 family protein [Sphingomonas aracearum]RDE06192.1 ATPase [Sphingomonas aracearum]